MSLDLIHPHLEDIKSEVILLLVEIILAMLHDEVIKELLPEIILVFVQTLSSSVSFMTEIENTSDYCKDRK